MEKIITAIILLVIVSTILVFITVIVGAFYCIYKILFDLDDGLSILEKIPLWIFRIWTIISNIFILVLIGMAIYYSMTGKPIIGG